MTGPRLNMTGYINSSCRDGSIKAITYCQKMVIDGFIGWNAFVIIGMSPEGHQKKRNFHTWYITDYPVTHYRPMQAFT